MNIKVPIQPGVTSTKTKVVVCKNCEGKGRVNVGNLREMHNHDSVICPVCCGIRLLKKVKTITYERV